MKFSPIGILGDQIKWKSFSVLHSHIPIIFSKVKLASAISFCFSNSTYLDAASANSLTSSTMFGLSCPLFTALAKYQHPSLNFICNHLKTLSLSQWKTGHSASCLLILRLTAKIYVILSSSAQDPAHLSLAELI